MQATDIESVSSQPPSVLLVEDDPLMQSLIEHSLSRSRFQVLTADDGEQAMERLDDGQPTQLAVFDLMLPHVDGLQLVRHTRTLKAWDQTPILILTSKSEERDVVHALDAGANDFMVKPFRPQELTARLRRLLATHEHRTPGIAG